MAAYVPACNVARSSSRFLLRCSCSPGPVPGSWPWGWLWAAASSSVCDWPPRSDRRCPRGWRWWRVRGPGWACGICLASDPLKISSLRANLRPEIVNWWYYGSKNMCHYTSWHWWAWGLENLVSSNIEQWLLFQRRCNAHLISSDKFRYHYGRRNDRVRENVGSTRNDCVSVKSAKQLTFFPPFFYNPWKIRDLAMHACLHRFTPGSKLIQVLIELVKYVLFSDRALQNCRGKRDGRFEPRIGELLKTCLRSSWLA